MIYYTTIEQSKKLVELGLNPDTADMVIVKENTYCNALSAFNGVTLCQSYSETKDKTNYIPCWSLGALLEVLKTRKDCNFITIHSSYSLKWIFNTSYYELANWKEKEIIGDTPIEAAYSMVCWLLENDYIKKGE